MLFLGDGVEADEAYALRFLTMAAEKVGADHLVVTTRNDIDIAATMVKDGQR